MPKSMLHTGYKPPLQKDPRNFPLEKAQPVVPFPTSFKTDLTGMPVFMQSEQPDCVENGVTYVKTYFDFKQSGVVTDFSRRSLVIPTVAQDGIPYDEGTSLQTALNVAHNQGISEAQYFSDDHTMTTEAFVTGPVPPAAVVNALTHKISSYAFVTDLTQAGLQSAIYQNGLVLIGIDIDNAWWTSKTGETSWAKSDILPIRPPTGTAITDTTYSRHIVALYGYDEQYFYFVNWWSNQWASDLVNGNLGTDGGFGYFGINDLPSIYEAATLVDITPEQIAALKQDTQQLATKIQNIDPVSPTAPQQESLIEEIIQDIEEII